MDSYTKLQEYMQSLIKKTIEENENKTRTEIMIENYIIDIPRPVKKCDKKELSDLLELKENLRKFRLERLIE